MKGMVTGLVIHTSATAMGKLQLKTMASAAASTI